MGTKMQAVNLLVDTQANGTAIDYDFYSSKRAKLHSFMGTGVVEVPSI
jgi:hypothetical protein